MISTLANLLRFFYLVQKRSDPYWRAPALYTDILMVCLHVLTLCPSPSQSLSKFNILLMVTGILIGRMDSACHHYHNVNFDDNSDGDKHDVGTYKQIFSYHQHPKDWEGNGFTLSTIGGGGGTPSPSHNTSTGPMSFLGVPSDWFQVPSLGGGGGTPSFPGRAGG